MIKQAKFAEFCDFFSLFSCFSSIWHAIFGNDRQQKTIHSQVNIKMNSWHTSHSRGILNWPRETRATVQASRKKSCHYFVLALFLTFKETLNKAKYKGCPASIDTIRSSKTPGIEQRNEKSLKTGNLAGLFSSFSGLFPEKGRNNPLVMHCRIFAFCLHALS